MVQFPTVSFVLKERAVSMLHSCRTPSYILGSTKLMSKSILFFALGFCIIIFYIFVSTSAKTKHYRSL